MIVGCECFAVRMKGFRDWILSQLVAKSVVLSRPLSGGDSFFSVERSTNEVITDQGISSPLILVSSISKGWFFSLTMKVCISVQFNVCL